MSLPSVISENRDGVFIISLNRPESKNAFDLEMRALLAEKIYEARDIQSVRAVIIRGEGTAFCAGGDLKSLSEEDRPIFRDRERIRRLHIWFRELVNLEKPTIAAVDGPAFGAGFNLALACDFIIGTPTARFAAVFSRIGLVPDLGGFFLLPRIVGLQRAKELVFSAREISAEEALGLGILHSVVPSESLFEAALNLASHFANASTDALGIAKNILNRSFNLDQDTLAELESSAQAMAIHSDYHREAVARFLSKQPMRFQWRP